MAACLALVLAVGCGSAPTAPSNPPGGGGSPVNRAPVISSVFVSPSAGVVDLQEFSFAVSASDPDGDPLSYAWDLGYGLTGGNSSSAFRGTYRGGAGGPVTVTVRVSDGKGGTADGSAQIVLVSMSGLWSASEGELAGTDFDLRQSAAGEITGASRSASGAVELLPSAGQILTSGAVVFPIRIGSRVVTLTGQVDMATGTRIAGTLSGAASGPFVMSKH